MGGIPLVPVGVDSVTPNTELGNDGSPLDTSVTTRS